MSDDHLRRNEKEQFLAPSSLEDGPELEQGADPEFRLPNRYRDIEGLGHGATGVVRRVWDERLNRQVAMKVMRDRTENARDQVLADRERFLAEPRIASQLGHPNIVQVFETIDADDGDPRQPPYFTMPIVTGGTLSKHAEALRSYGADGRNRLLAAFVQLCQAVEHAHARGVVHRDLKPDNILVTQEGSPVIADWGFAFIKDLNCIECSDTGFESRLRQLANGTVVRLEMSPKDGTPGYRAPEQEKGDTEQISYAADIFALGAILRELLSGRRAGKSMRPLPAGTPRELIAICEKALRRDVAQRYASAADLKEDVSCYLNHLPLMNLEGFREGIGRWVARQWQRRPRLAMVASAIPVMAIAVLTAVLISQLNANARVKKANVALRGEQQRVLQTNSELREERESLAETVQDLHELVDTVEAQLVFISDKPGTVAIREELLERAIAILENAQAHNRETPATGRLLMVAFVQRGDALREHGDPAANLDYSKAEELARILVEESGTHQSRLDLAVVEDRLGDMALKQGKLTEADDRFQSMLRLFNGLGDSSDEVIDGRCTAHQRLGDLRIREARSLGQQRQFQAALQSLDQAEKHFRQLIAASTRADRPDRLLTGHRGLGDILFFKLAISPKEARRLVIDARANYLKALELATLNPILQVRSQEAMQTYLALQDRVNFLSMRYLGDLTHEDRVREFKQLVDDWQTIDRENIAPATARIAARHRLAAVLQARGEFVEARSECIEALAIAENHRQSENPRMIVDLFKSHCQVAMASGWVGEREQVVHHFTAALRVADAHPGLIPAEGLRGVAAARLMAWRLVGDLAANKLKFEDVPTRDMQSRVLEFQVRERVVVGDLEGAFEAAKTLDRLSREANNFSYDAAAAYAWIHGGASADDHSLASMGEAASQRAIELLEVAVDTSFRDVGQLKLDPHFRSLRASPEFNKILRLIENQGSQ